MLIATELGSGHRGINLMHLTPILLGTTGNMQCSELQLASWTVPLRLGILFCCDVLYMFFAAQIKCHASFSGAFPEQGCILYFPFQKLGLLKLARRFVIHYKNRDHICLDFCVAWGDIVGTAYCLE